MLLSRGTPREILLPGIARFWCRGRRKTRRGIRNTRSYRKFSVRSCAGLGL